MSIVPKIRIQNLRQRCLSIVGAALPKFGNGSAVSAEAGQKMMARRRYRGDADHSVAAIV